VPLEDFFFPLDRLAAWNRLYGRRGLLQYQLAVPADAARGLAETVLARAAKAGLPPFLAVLKRFGAGRQMLSFPIPGYTLALDFPATRKTMAMLSGWNRMVAEAGGRIYLAKDAISDPATIVGSYPGLPAFAAVRDEVDPRRRLSSLLSRRLGL
jgi:FAD/FMN-containing dehydrogenase